MSNKTMPGRGNKSAPSFTENPKDLMDYLEDVKNLCVEHGKKDDADWIQYALYYLPAEAREYWRRIPEAKDVTSALGVITKATWDAFVQAVLNKYPGAREKGRYELSDLQDASDQRHLAPPQDLHTLGEYTRTFERIGLALKEESAVSDPELARLFERGLGEALKGMVKRRLEIKFPDHPPTRPHKLADLISASEFCLTGTSTFIANQKVGVKEHSVKIEGFEPAAVVQAVLQALTLQGVSTGQNKNGPSNAQGPQSQRNPQANSGNVKSTSAQRFEESTRRNQFQPRCFCGGTECRSWNVCPVHRKAVEDKVVLISPGGRTTLWDGSRDFPRGEGSLYDRIVQWNLKNPHLKPTGQPEGKAFLLEVTRPGGGGSRIPPSSTFLSNEIITEQPEQFWNATLNLNQKENTGPGNNYKGPPMPPGKRMAFRGVEIPKTTWKKPPFGVDPKAAHDAAPGPNLPPGYVLPKQAQQTKPTVTAAPSAPKPQQVQQKGNPQIGSRNPFRADDQQYRTQLGPGLNEKESSDRVFDTILGGSSTLSNKDLLAVAPEIRKRIKEVVSNRRILQDVAQTGMLAIGDDDEEPLSEENLESVEAGELIDAFYQSLADQGVIVGAESLALRAITPVIDHKYEVEAILDEGAQLVAMSEEVWEHVGLPLDTSTRIQVQSANKGVESALGVCRNVPFTIGNDLTIFLQVHVLRGVAYDILLGRPFGVLTESVTRNYIDGKQTITLRDPNSERTIAIPTHKKGVPRFSAPREHELDSPHIHTARANTHDQ